MRNIILILSLNIACTSLAKAAIVCKNQFKSLPGKTDFCGDGIVSIRFPNGISKIYSAPISIHIGDINCWFGNFDGMGELGRSGAVVVQNILDNPGSPQQAIGVSYFSSNQTLHLELNFGSDNGFVLHRDYKLDCSEEE